MAAQFANMAAPESPLARYRLLAPSAAVRVSPLCLGGMNFGDAWTERMGACSKENAFKIMDYFFENGGNFIDTASNYQDGQSETWIGEWMAARGNRDEIVLATKYTTNYVKYPDSGKKLLINYGGNSAKTLFVSLEDSLKKLNTHYIDILYVHWWDHTTSIPELMQSLNYLVASRKVLYLGISDAPAWVVATANEYARSRGMAQFVIYQGLWSAAERSMEREIIPMAHHHGMALAPWGALGSGKFRTAEQLAKGEGRKGPFSEPSPAEKAVVLALEKVASRHNTNITSIALAYVVSKTPYVFPIVGGRTVDHLKGNVEALKLKLTTDDLKEIEASVPFELGFPHNFIGTSIHQNAFLKIGGHLDLISAPQAIQFE